MIKRLSEEEVAHRRQFLKRMLSLGLLAGVGPTILSACGGTTVSSRSKPGINQVDGRVLIDGAPARAGMQPGTNSLIETGPDAMLALVMGADAFLIRENTRLRFTPAHGASAAPALLAQAGSQTVTDTPTGPKVAVSPNVFGFSLESGKVLSVFSEGSRVLRTPSFTVGIRGTGIYLESQTRQGTEDGYACTCYGTVDFQSRLNPSIKETITSKHHDAPRRLTSSRMGIALTPMPFINHTDAELIMLEALVGRVPAFQQGTSSSSSRSTNRSSYTPNVQPTINVPVPMDTHAPMSVPHAW